MFFVEHFCGTLSRLWVGFGELGTFTQLTEGLGMLRCVRTQKTPVKAIPKRCIGAISPAVRRSGDGCFWNTIWLYGRGRLIVPASIVVAVPGLALCGSWLGWGLTVGAISLGDVPVRGPRFDLYVWN